MEFDTYSQNLQQDAVKVEGLAKRLSKVEDQLGRIMYWLKSKHGQDFDQVWDPVIQIPKVDTNELGMVSKVQESLTEKVGSKFDLDLEDFPSRSSVDSNFNETLSADQTDNCFVKIEVSDYESENSSGSPVNCEVVASCYPNKYGTNDPEEKKLKNIGILRRIKGIKPKEFTATHPNPSRKYVCRPITCEICGVSLLGRRRYFHHQAEVHQINRSMIRCSKCSKRFLTQNSLSRHDEIMHNETRTNTNLCSVCGASLPDIKRLQSHEKRSHNSQGSQQQQHQKHLCQHCGKSFKSGNGLKHHEKSHIKSITRKESEMFAKKVSEFYENVNRDKKETLRHFVHNEGKPCQTIYSIIKVYETCGDITSRKIPGRPPKKSSLEAEQQIIEEIKNNPNVSCRQLAKKFGIPSSTLNDIKVNKLGIRSNRKKAVKK